MGFVSEDRIADVVEVRNLYIVKKNAIFQLAGISDNCVFTDYGRAAYVRAVTNFRA